MSRLDEIRAEIVDRLERAQATVARIEIELDKARAGANECNAELAGHDIAVAAMAKEKAEPPAPQKRQRNDIRGAVRSRLDDAGDWMDERHLAIAVAPSGITADALHKYLLRAEKAGEVERDGDRYRLPLPAQSRPAELSLAEMDAAG